MQFNLPDSGEKKGNLCPFLGLSDDPGTALAYPSVGNCCHHAKPVASVRNGMQARYCLLPGYVKCPVYLRSDLQPLPPDFIGEGRLSSGMRKWVVGGVLLVTILVLAFVIVQSNAASFIWKKKPTPDANSQVLLTVTAIIRNTQMAATIQPSPTTTATEFPTLMVPSPAPTSIPMHELEMPIGTNPPFVIHRVQAGESFIRFEEDYSTTKAAILAVNYGMESSLWANSIIIIPVGVTDVTGLPAFLPYQVTEANLTVEQLALNAGADLATLKQYNALPDGYVFSEGEWVLIPK